jgi:hypothetical protein
LAANNTRVAATGYFYDSALNPESYYVVNLREGMNISFLYGEKLSVDGTLMFQPSTVGIDVYDARVGILLSRIALPITLSSQYDALVSDGTDNVLVAITGDNSDGVAVIDLSSIPAPAALPYEKGVTAANKRAGTMSATATLPRNTRAQASGGSKRNPSPRRCIPHVTQPVFRH